ncbi:MAG: methylated-DNA--[protein]-cysteine S-methyltransferase [Saprospiraceae bacterium]
MTHFATTGITFLNNCKKMPTTAQSSLLIYDCIESPLGTLLMAAVEQGVCLLEFEGTSGRAEQQMQILAKELGSDPVEGQHPHLAQLHAELRAFFSGKRAEFDVPLVFIGTDFQKSVWQELLRIPYGTTRSYKQQALALNAPLAIRAVAGANGRNPIAIVVPCHRVIGGTGSLTGYGGGLWRKQWLLELERDSGLAVPEPGGQLSLL